MIISSFLSEKIILKGHIIAIIFNLGSTAEQRMSNIQDKMIITELIFYILIIKIIFNKNHYLIKIAFRYQKNSEIIFYETKNIIRIFQSQDKTLKKSMK